MKYKCFNCNKDVDLPHIEKRVICPYCGSRIILKKRPKVLKKVKAD